MAASDQDEAARRGAEGLRVRCMALAVRFHRLATAYEELASVAGVGLAPVGLVRVLLRKGGGLLGEAHCEAFDHREQRGKHHGLGEHRDGWRLDARRRQATL